MPIMTSSILPSTPQTTTDPSLQSNPSPLASSSSSVAAPLSSMWTEEVMAILAAMVGGARYGIKVRVPHAVVMTMLFKPHWSAQDKIRAILTLALDHATKLATFATLYKTILLLLKQGSRYLRQYHILDDKAIGRKFLSMIVDGPFRHYSSPTTVSLSSSSSLSRPAGHPEHNFHSFVAGCIGGYYVWGNDSSISQQVLLYLVSRIQMALIKKVWEHHHQQQWSRSGGEETSLATDHEYRSSILSDRQSSSSSSSSSPPLPLPSWGYPLLAASAWGVVMILFEDSPHVLQPSLRSSMEEIYRYPLSSWRLPSFLSSFSSQAPTTHSTTRTTTIDPPLQ